MQLTVDSRSRDRAFELLGKKNATKACVRALNRSIASARTLAVKVVRQDMGLKAGVVRDRITVIKATASRQIARLAATTERTPLINFNAKALKRGGVKAKLPSPGKGRYPNAFIAKMPSGHIGVYQRAGKPRLPIYELRGPSVAQSVTRHADDINAKAAEVFQKNFDHEVQYRLRAEAFQFLESQAAQ
jgi:hypothetical protein